MIFLKIDAWPNANKKKVDDARAMAILDTILTFKFETFVNEEFMFLNTHYFSYTWRMLLTILTTILIIKFTLLWHLCKKLLFSMFLFPNYFTFFNTCVIFLYIFNFQSWHLTQKDLTALQQCLVSLQQLEHMQRLVK